MIGFFRIVLVTAYSFGCGATGLTAVTHRQPVPHYTIAVDRNVIHGGALVQLDHPMLSGHLWYAEDTGAQSVGGLIAGNHVDIMVENCDVARQWGKQYVKLSVVDIIPPKGDKHTDAEHGKAWSLPKRAR